jgi:Bacterial Ig domain
VKPKPHLHLKALLVVVLAIAGVVAGSGAAGSGYTVASQVGSTSLRGGMTLSGSVTWTATTNDSATAKVEFSIDGTLKWTEYKVPYYFNGDGNKLDTTTLSDGSHTLKVMAYRSDGKSSSTSATVSVSNKKPPPPPFTTTLSIANGATLSGSVTWTASPSGATVSKVDFLIDGTVKWTEYKVPYYFNGDGKQLVTTTLPNGGHTLSVNAYATDGRKATASSAVTVSNSTAPPPVTVSSSVPNGATLSGAVTWTASPSGATISKVDFLVDGNVKSTDSTSPYQYNGTGGTLDTTTLSNGGHTLAVKATATDSRTASASSSVTVSNSTTPPPPTTLPSYGFALGGKSLFRSPADRAFELDQLQAAANGHRALVRMDSTPGNQPYLDSWVNDALARNLEPVLLLWSTTGPITPQAAGDFAAAQGAKWKGKIRFFEFANEPDINGWTPEQYTACLKATYTGLKQADPNAILIAGALWKWDQGPTANPSGGAREWVTRMYAAGAKGYFDMLSLHLYDDPDTHGSWNLWDQAFTMSPSIRSIMDSNGNQSIPIVSTETGGPASKYGEDGQATIVDHDFNHLYSGQLRMMLVYTMLNDDVSGFGLLRDDRSRRPAWYTFQKRAT